MQNIYRISVFMYNIPMVLKTIKKKRKKRVTKFPFKYRKCLLQISHFKWKHSMETYQNGFHFHLSCFIGMSARGAGIWGLYLAQVASCTSLQESINKVPMAEGKQSLRGRLHTKPIDALEIHDRYVFLCKYQSLDSAHDKNLSTV